MFFVLKSNTILGREHGLPIGKLTHEVVTLWYRPPEILLGQEKYGGACDMWGVGCIIAEMATRHALFPGDCEIDQLYQIFQVLGTPNENIWPGVSNLPDYKLSFPQWKPKDLNKILKNQFDQNGIKLIKQLLTYPPNNRITAKAALASPWFDQVREHVTQKLVPFYQKQELLFQQLNGNYKRSIMNPRYGINTNSMESKTNDENINVQNVNNGNGRNFNQNNQRAKPSRNNNKNANKNDTANSKNNDNNNNNNNRNRDKNKSGMEIE